MKGLVDIDVRDIDFDHLGDLVGETFDVDLAADHVHLAAFLLAYSAPGKVEVDFGADRFGHIDKSKVGVEESAGDRVLLNFAQEDGKRRMPGDFKLEAEEGIAACAFERFDKFVFTEGELNGGLAIGVGDSGEMALAAGLAGRAFSMLGARESIQNDSFHEDRAFRQVEGEHKKLRKSDKKRPSLPQTDRAVKSVAKSWGLVPTSGP